MKLTTKISNWDYIVTLRSNNMRWVNVGDNGFMGIINDCVRSMSEYIH